MHVLFGILLLLIVVDFLRMDFDVRFPLYQETEKKKEHKNYHALTLSCIAIVLSLQFYAFPIAITAIFMSQFGDVAGAVVGRAFGTRKLFRHKTFEGSLAVFTVALIGGFYFLRNMWIIIPMALATALIELSTERMEDNFIIPLMVGLVGTLLLYFF